MHLLSGVIIFYESIYDHKNIVNANCMCQLELETLFMTNNNFDS